MTNRALTMPEYVADLVRLPLLRLGLEPSPLQDDIVTCSLMYEDGTELSVVVMCVAERRWFRERPVLLLSFVEFDGNTRATKVYHTERMPVPTGPSDFPFMVQVSIRVRAIAWSLAATAGMGECRSLPGREKWA